ncbi:MAG: hypothetical protein FIA97_13065 [Methylococcaceae bacterium]|nr:hypothetical protein [Methylococcaceae bacterium]
MTALIRLFADICLFRKGPQHLPASSLLLALAGSFYLVTGWILLGLESGWLNGAIQVAVAGGLLLAFVRTTLASCDKRHRLLQTLTALTGTDGLLTGVAIACYALTSALPDLRNIALTLLTLWDLAVIAHILRHALSQGLAMGVGLAAIYFFAVRYLLTLIMGGS